MTVSATVASPALDRAVTSAGPSPVGRITEDVSVIGYDDTYAMLPAPRLLTTVHTPVPELGALAVRTVLGLRDGVAPVSHHVDLATSLVVRETTSPPIQ